MPQWVLITLVLLSPFLPSAIGLIVLRRWRNPKLDHPLNLSQAWHRLLSLVITPREFIKLLLFILPLLFLDQIVRIIPNDFTFIAIVAWLVYKISNQQSQHSAKSQEVINFGGIAQPRCTPTSRSGY